jgi:hypothetical protein
VVAELTLKLRRELLRESLPHEVLWAWLAG